MKFETKIIPNLADFGRDGKISTAGMLRIFEDLGECQDVTMDVKQSKVKVALLPSISTDAAISKIEELKKGPMYNMQSVQYEHC